MHSNAHHRGGSRLAEKSAGANTARKAVDGNIKAPASTAERGHKRHKERYPRPQNRDTPRRKHSTDGAGGEASTPVAIPRTTDRGEAFDESALPQVLKDVASEMRQTLPLQSKMRKGRAKRPRCRNAATPKRGEARRGGVIRSC